MEFMNRGLHQTPPKPEAANAEAPPTSRAPSRKASGHLSKLMSVSYFVLLISGTVLIIAVLVSLIFGKTNDESRYVDKNNLQAIFLNNGQVYFGKINTLGKDYVRLNNVYYLRANNQNQDPTKKDAATTDPNNVSLAKLGCELHGPQDQMIINRSEITFWENLKDKDHNSQVTKAVQDYIAANPSGQKCDATQGGSTTQSDTTNPNTTAPASSTSTPTPAPAKKP